MQASDSPPSTYTPASPPKVSHFAAYTRPGPQSLSVLGRPMNASVPVQRQPLFTTSGPQGQARPRKATQKHSTRESTIIAFANLSVKEGWSKSALEAYPIPLDILHKYLDIILKRVELGTFSMNTLSVNLSYLSGHHNQLGLDRWASQVKNHPSIKERIEKYVSIYGNKSKKQKYDKMKREGLASASNMSALAAAAMTVNSRPTASSKHPLSPQPVKYLPPTQTAQNSALYDIERQVRTNEWVAPNLPVFPLSLAVFEHYVEFLLVRVKRGTMGLTRVQVIISYLSKYHREQKHEDWSEKVRGPVMSTKMNELILKQLTMSKHVLAPTVEKFESFAMSRGVKTVNYPASLSLVHNWIDSMVFDEFAAPDQVSRHMELLCDHHTNLDLAQSWTDLILTPEILGRFEFMDEHYLDPVIYFTRLALYKRWERSQLDLFPISRTNYQLFLKHQMDRCYSKLIDLKNVHECVELLADYQRQIGVEWSLQVQYDGALMDSISFPMKRIPSSAKTQTKPQPAPAFNQYQPQKGIAGDRKLQSPVGRIVLPPLTPSPSPGGSRRSLQSYAAKHMADIDRQFLAALTSGSIGGKRRHAMMSMDNERPLERAPKRVA